MNIITAENLTKVYRTTIRKPGLAGAFQSLFHAEYSDKTAVDHITFHVEDGEALACIGENGAGKSTLIKMLVGILNPTTGSMSVNGFNPTDHKEDYLRSIGVIFGQKTNLWWDIPIIESYNAVQVLYKIPKPQFDETLKTVTELLDLSPILDRPARRLSLGQRMKADIAMVFLHRPRLLFLDEPTIGLDINVKHTIRRFIRQMNREQGVSVFLTSHDLDDIEQICDNAMILHKGSIVYRGGLNELKQAYITQKVVRITGEVIQDIQNLLPGVTVTRNERYTSVSYDYRNISSSELLSVINQCFNIEDISIQDPGIEQVVSEIYATGGRDGLR